MPLVGGFARPFFAGTAFMAVLSCSFFAATASADTTHVVARGHTLESIANRYHVPAKAILEANKLKNPNRLRPGDTLVIPGVTPKDKKDGKSTLGADAKEKGAKENARGAKTGEHKDGKKTKPPTYAMRAKNPGVVHLARLATTEDAKLRLVDRRGRNVPQAAKPIEKLLRSASGQSKPIEPRLMALLAIVSDHFGGRKIEVISGYRPYAPTQHTAHSNHNVGKAIDFRVVGVPNEVVRDFCRTLRNVGVGYYPNSTFVHLDARTTPAFWIDYSRPGEPPRYNDPNVEADEGTSDVGADVLTSSDGKDSDTANTAPEKTDEKGATESTERPTKADDKASPAIPTLPPATPSAAQGAAVPAASPAAASPPAGGTPAAPSAPASGSVPAAKP